MTNKTDSKYNIDIFELLKQANQNTKQNFGGILLLSAIILILSMGMLTAYLNILGISDVQAWLEQKIEVPMWKQVTFNLVLTAVGAPLWAGIIMMAIKTARGQSETAVNSLQYYRQIVVLALASILVSTLTTLGLGLYILPGIYLMLVTSFTTPLVIDKGYSPINAIKLSIIESNKILKALFVLALIFVMAAILIIFTIGIAYIWVGPLFFNVKALLYQRLFYDIDELQQYESVNGEEGRFDA